MPRRAGRTGPGCDTIVKSIRSNILAFAVLATLIPSVGLGLISFVGYQDVVNRNVDYELRALSKDASGELALWARERAHDIRTLTTAYTLVDGLRGGTPRPGALRIGAPELAVYLKSVQKKLDPLIELTLRDATGQVVASSAAEPAAIELPATWQSASLATGIVVAPPRWDEARVTATMAIAVPVLSARNEQIGALTAVLDLRSIEPRLRAGVGASPAEVMLLATDGTPLVSTRSAASTLPKLDAQALVHLRGQPGEAQRYVDVRGREAVGVAAPPSAFAVVVLAQRERAEVFAEWLSLVKLYLAVVAALMLLVGVVAYWMGRSIVTPLAALAAAAKRVAGGDFSVTLHDQTNDEIGELNRAFNAMTDRLRTSQRALESANAALRRNNDELASLATTDSLTGLYNRKKLDEILRACFATFTRDGAPFALLMVSLDHLDVINADYGLPAGDDVLVKLAAILRQTVGEGDPVARFGGERFVAVVAGVAFDDAMDLAERIRSLVEAPDFGGHAIRSTVSIGVAQSREGDASAETVLFRADHALHEARRAGGNRVQSAM